MTDLTRLDVAHAEMEATPDDASARLRFYETLAASELYLLLKSEVEGDRIDPDLFELSDHSYVLVFDREDRLGVFAGRAVPYAALSGRMIASLLAGQGVGLGVNLDGAPSSILIPPEAVDWLSETLGQEPSEIEARPEKFTAPRGLPENFMLALDARLASAAGLARLAYLVGVTYEGGARGHMLGFVDAVPGARAALARAVSEVLIFSELEAAALDVAFLSADDPAAARLAAAGLRFDLPQPAAPEPRAATGMDPDRPPRLR
ncbi:SseB protein N-terminal domain-containing protein [Roseovarius azorensis]|uniref:SseB protein N-terminal domain-containing protein n=1 Tax=Roseovarius azorensis TaxID=1287727 RepID=A0A1H7WMH4_9RHOB|nr:SseB family protein [Roseovarius azorensis]SEM22661.1 SseB protein N-terminal domain-containing protein [Roseovarius azorensis]